MLQQLTPPPERRQKLRTLLASGKLLTFPGSFSAASSLLIEQAGFDGIYVSGAVLSADLGLPDIGLTTLTEVISRGSAITQVTSLPSIIDLDTGFGEPMNVGRSIRFAEDAGLSGCHIEDQVNPKRCGHLDHKQLISAENMVQRIQIAARARRDKNFLIIARTDARGVEGIDAAIHRAQAYVDAGADMIFPEALETAEEFEKVRKSISAPLLANMTEFGKSPLFTQKQLTDLGYNIAIYPVTLFRLALGAAERGLAAIRQHGSQESVVSDMMTRKRLYELLDYERFNELDQSIFNFTVPSAAGGAQTSGKKGEKK